MKTVAIQGTNIGDGATTVALNLAAAMAETGRTTLLADADPDGEFERIPGLSEFGSALDREGRLVARSTPFRGLSALPSLGRALAAGDAGALDRVARFAETTDWVVFDLPPGDDANRVLDRCDLVFVVFRPAASGFASLPAALEGILAARERSGRIRLAGAIPNAGAAADETQRESDAARIALDEIRAAFPRAIAGTGLPLSPALARSRAELKPLSRVEPGDPVSSRFFRDLVEAARRAAEVGDGGNDAVATPRTTENRRRPGFLGRLLSRNA